MGGDECALCGSPVGDDPAVFENDDGSTGVLCAECARRIDQKLPLFDPINDPATYAVTPAEVPGALHNLADAVGAAEALAAFLRGLGPALEELQADLTASESRVRLLESELARLTDRLQRVEGLLATAAAAPTAPAPATIDTEGAPAPTAVGAGAPHPAGIGPQAEANGAAQAGVGGEVAASHEMSAAAWADAGLTADDVRLVQRYFAESAATEKMRAVRRSLGRPMVNLHPIPGEGLRVMVTIAWEIVWYQFLVELGPDLGPDDRVSVFAEGMEPQELAPQYREENATLDQGGRVDASELELALLAQPPELLTQMPADRAAALDDATEEIWNKRGQPEFRWDD